MNSNPNSTKKRKKEGKKKDKHRPDVVAQVYNPSYCETEIGRIIAQSQLGQNALETLSQPMAGCGGACLTFQLKGKPK
jgi:hypothetical protein